jgi:hypothetical protein
VSSAAETLLKFTASWERRAQVKRSGVLEIDFEPDLPDFLPELLPGAVLPAVLDTSARGQSRLLTYGWLAFNQKAIDIEHNVLMPACLRLLELASEAGDVVAADAVSQALVDEAYHILLVRQANQRTLAERRLPAPSFPLCRTVERMREHQARFPARWQRDLTAIGAAIVTEVFIKGYLGQLSQAEGVQPLSVLVTRAHLADEAVHASIFVMLAEQLYRRLDPQQREFLAEVLIRAMSWFPDPELPTLEVAIRTAALPGSDELLRRCRMDTRPDIDYRELTAFLGRVGVEDVDRHIARVHALETGVPA